MAPRFFVPAATTTGSLVDLPEDEAVHLVRVLRLRTGAAIAAFDGRGHEWRGVVEKAGRERASIRLVEQVASQPEPGVRVVLTVAVLKGDKMDDVVRDAVMLGAVGIRPLVSARVEMPGQRPVSEARRARWQRIAVASAKQCGRAVVPEVLPTTQVGPLLNEVGTRPRIALMEPRSAGRGRRMADLSPADQAELVIGPEGGWTHDEADRLAAACELVTLGSQTLRADAVPLIAMTALRVAWNDF